MIRIPSWRPTDVSKRIPYGHHAEDRRGRKPLHAPERTIKLISQNNVLHRASIQKSSIFSSRSAISIDFFKYSGSQCQRFIAENLDGARCKALGRRRERSSRGAESEPGEHGEDQEGLLGDHGGEEREGGTERHEGVPQARCHGHAAAPPPRKHRHFSDPPPDGRLRPHHRVLCDAPPRLPRRGPDLADRDPTSTANLYGSSIFIRSLQSPPLKRPKKNGISLLRLPVRRVLIKIHRLDKPEY